jgi:putative flippase GtrA
MVFAVVGAIATGIQYLVLVLCVEVFGTSPALGSGIGYVLSSVANYAINHRFTFRSSRSHPSAVGRFLVVASIGLVLNVSMMTLFAEHLRIQYLLAQVLATGVTLVWNFLGSAFFSFANPAADRTRAVRKESAGDT